MLSEKIMHILLFMPFFLFSMTFHEAAHAWMANRLGDPTAKLAGRLTLDPRPHSDLIGTILLPLIGLYMGGMIFGWGIPVPVDYRKFKNPRRDAMWVALAGPLSNLILAVILAGIIHAFRYAAGGGYFPLRYETLDLVHEALLSGFFLNLSLTFFNLIPVEPLDGGKIASGILPRNAAYALESFSRQYGTFILLFLFLTGLVRVILGPPILGMAWILGVL